MSVDYVIGDSMSVKIGSNEAERNVIYFLAAGKVRLLMAEGYGGHSLETAVSMVVDEGELDRERLYKALALGEEHDQ